MRFTGRGHRAVRATHDKTLELAALDHLTERGTCIVAVATEAAPPHPLAGPIRLRIAVGALRFSLDAVANPSWEPDGPIVVRRGPLRLPGTFATDADAAASDLPRDLVTALQDPDALVTVDVLPRPSEPVVVLCAADPDAATPGPALLAELDRADEVVAEDASARRLVGASRGEPGGRTVVVATARLPGTSLTERLPAAAVETLGLSPELAVAAASGPGSPLTFATADSLRRVPASHRLVVTVERRHLPDLLTRSTAVRGTGAAVVMQVHGRPLAAAPGAIPALDGADLVACCLQPAVGSDALDPAVRAAVSSLLADGVATKPTAKALAALAGWDRRRAYDAVIGWPKD